MLSKARPTRRSCPIVARRYSAFRNSFALCSRRVRGVAGLSTEPLRTCLLSQAFLQARFLRYFLSLNLVSFLFSLYWWLNVVEMGSSKRVSEEVVRLVFQLRYDGWNKREIGNHFSKTRQWAAHILANYSEESLSPKVARKVGRRRKTDEVEDGFRIKY